MKLQASPVKQCAVAKDWPVAQPRSLRLDGKYPDEACAARDTLLAARPDVMVVAAYGLILPQWVLDLPVHGCLNIHASLLPRWRGAAPIHRAIEAGDAQTGITIMQMDAGLDTGDMLLRESLDIGDDNTARLHDRLADMGGRMIAEALARIGTLTRTPQPAEGVTYASKVEKQEALIDWAQPGDAIVRRVRAFDPFPGANSPLDGETIKLWSAHVDRAATALAALDVPGTILAVSDTGVTVAAADAAVTVTELQRPGGKRLAVADFLRGFDLKPGQAFG
jgi:methionyl-tRNA formyltransferase